MIFQCRGSDDAIEEFHNYDMDNSYVDQKISNDKLGE